MSMSLQKCCSIIVQSTHKHISWSSGPVWSQGILVCDLSKVFSLADKLSKDLFISLQDYKVLEK